MGDDRTSRWALPLLAAGQAQKEMTVNEALARLDLAVQASVVAMGLDAPPPAPVAGQCWVVGDAPTGAWAGQAGALAGWTDGGWRFLTPGEGTTVWSVADGAVATLVGGTWRQGVTVGGVRVVGPRQAAVADPAGGATVDAEARAVLTAVLQALRTHGLIAA